MNKLLVALCVVFSGFAAYSNASVSVSDDFDEAVICRQEFTNAERDGSGPKMNNVCAYRLDFLATLHNIDGSPLVQFGDGTTDTEVAHIPITLYEERGMANVEAAIAPMYLLRANDGMITSAITIDTPAAVLEANNLGRNLGPAMPGDPDEGAEWILNAAGTNGANGERRAFSQVINYSGGIALNQAEQRKWFLVPNSSGGAVDAVLIPEANAIQNAIEYAINRML